MGSTRVSWVIVTMQQFIYSLIAKLYNRAEVGAKADVMLFVSYLAISRSVTSGGFARVRVACISHACKCCSYVKSPAKILIYDFK